MAAVPTSLLPDYESISQLTRIAESVFIPGGKLIRDGKAADHVWFVKSGIVAAETVANNGKRSLASIYLPGEPAGLSCAMQGRADFALRAMSEVTADKVPSTALRDLALSNPGVGAQLWQMTLRESAIARKLAVSLALQDAQGKLSHLLCELGMRLERAGLGTRTDYECPFTQDTLGDLTGLTSVHVNRSLRALRHAELIQTHRREVVILDWTALARRGEFDPSYLG